MDCRPWQSESSPTTSGPDVAILADYVRPGGIVSLMLPNPMGMVLRQYQLIATKP